MNAEQIQKKLEAMKGHSFEYAKQIHKVKSYVIDEESFTIKTDHGSFDRKLQSAKAFFEYWIPKEEQETGRSLSVPGKGSSSPAILLSGDEMNKSSALADELVAILKSNITKVGASASYIPQAMAIDKNVDTILKVKRMQLDLYKAAKEKKI